MSAAVVSVEGFSFTISASSTSNSADLTKGQTLANCVVFKSARVASDVNESLYCDAELASGPDRVIVSRIGSAGAVDVQVWVIEFDPAEVTVQQGTFTLTGSTTGATAITTVDPDATWVVAHYKTTDTLDDNDSGHVRFRLDAESDGIDFARAAADGNVSGHFFVAEALNAAWDVEHVEANSSSNGVLDQEIAIIAIDTSKTFSICSFSLSTGSDLAPHMPDVGLEDTDNLQVTRSNAAISPNAAFVVWAQVVELLDSTVGSVQHGLFSAATTSTDTDTISAVDLDRSVALADSALAHGMQTDGGSNSRLQPFGRVTFGSTTTITGDRGGSTGTWEMYWQAIEWEIAAGGGADLVEVIDELVELHESIARSLALNRTRDDVAELHESLARAMVLNRIRDDVADIHEDPEKSGALARFRDDLAQILEDSVSAKFLGQVIDELVQIFETRAQAQALSRIRDDLEQVIEANARSGVFVRTVSDVAELVESISRSRMFALAVDDLIHLVENLASGIATSDVLLQVGRIVSVLSLRARELVSRLAMRAEGD